MAPPQVFQVPVSSSSGSFNVSPTGDGLLHCYVKPSTVCSPVPSSYSQLSLPLAASVGRPPCALYPQGDSSTLEDAADQVDCGVSSRG